ncbi:recombinase family protein [Crossiella cryophila]|uniref:DNA invertase Pin-like site-specific DNA recombinase n=1 Tax=Crossiella cryophila TaxID=43355 RepID=A0A7W7FXE2_9PSEU|nr:recombinase family protein [Crossiella cryophila]MBB4680543.1 DNA invertase Pin-like site-specific DNA recombinase [Crossiella cryophila]
MTTTPPRRERGRTLIERDPDQLVWALSARESKVPSGRGADDEGQVDHQLSDLRKFVKGIGGRIEREVPEPNVSSFRRKRVKLPDGTFGYRVVRPDWEAILTALRRGECNALAVVDIDRATRDPRILEDLIDVVELYGVYVVSMTGNIDLSSDAGIDSARSLVNQRNSESRNTSRRVVDGKRRAAYAGKNHGGRMRPFGWRKDRLTLNKRESAHIKEAVPRILAGVSPLILAQQWNKRGIKTVTGVPWLAATIRGIFFRPRICGVVTHHGDVLRDENGNPVRGQWEPILTEEQYDAVKRAWSPAARGEQSRLGAKGRGYRTIYLLSPFVRCGKCNARMIGTARRDPRTKRMIPIYRCQAKGAGGCSGIGRVAEPIDEYIKALVIADQQRIESRKVEELPPWSKEKELEGYIARIEESIRRYESGEFSAERHFPSLARMEAKVAELRREQHRYNARQDARRNFVVDLAKEWDSPEFTMEQKQAAIAKSLTAVVIQSAGKGVRFHPDQLIPVFRRDT